MIYNILDIHSQTHDFDASHGAPLNLLLLVFKTGRIGVGIELEVRRNQVDRYKNLHGTDIRKEPHLELDCHTIVCTLLTVVTVASTTSPLNGLNMIA